MTDIANQELQSEIASLREYIERHDSLIVNGPSTICNLQEECDRWRDAVADLCLIVNPTVQQLMKAGFSVQIEIKE